MNPLFFNKLLYLYSNTHIEIIEYTIFYPLETKLITQLDFHKFQKDLSLLHISTLIYLILNPRQNYHHPILFLSSFKYTRKLY